MKTAIERIREIIEEDEYEIYGIRADDGIVYSVGDTCYPSREVFQDEVEGLEYDENLGAWVGEELSGTCALRVLDENVEEMLNNAHMYGKHISLIAGYGYEWGYDPDEVIIYDAIVLDTIWGGEVK